LEFAAIFPTFVFLLFAVIDGGLLMGRYNNVNNAAKEGARLAAVGALQPAVVTRVKEQAHHLLDSVPANGDCRTYAADANAICVEWIKGPNDEAPGAVGASIRVRVKYQYNLITPLASKVVGAWNVEACAIQRQELGVSGTSILANDPIGINKSVTSCG
jgi:hypothetical protein